MKEDSKLKQQMSDYSKEIDALKYKSIKTKVLKPEV